MAGDAAFFGIPEEALNAPSSDESCEVWEENADVVRFFLEMQTQWVFTFSSPVGLNYVAAGLLMDISGISDRRRLMDGLRCMEFAALDELRMQRK